MKRAYLIEIKPTTEQVSKIRQTIGVCRYVYNLYISKNK
ncbi:TPA: helix-turn-helix domain-containing protein, partial [Bacillus cereus]